MSIADDFLKQQKKIEKEMHEVYTQPAIDPSQFEDGETIRGPTENALKEIASNTKSLEELKRQTELLEKQVKEVGEIADTAHKVADSAMKKSEKAGCQSKLSLVIAFAGLLLQIIVNWGSILSFFRSFMNR